MPLWVLHFHQMAHIHVYMYTIIAINKNTFLFSFLDMEHDWIKATLIPEVTAKHMRQISRIISLSSQGGTRTSQIIRYRATVTLMRLQIKQNTASNEGGGRYITNENII